MEFVVVASTRMLEGDEPSEPTYGMIGPAVFNEDLKKFSEKGHINLDFGNRGGSSLNTYIMPCRGFGLLHTDMNDSSAPVGITPRGTEIYEVRKKHLFNEGIKKTILEGGTLTKKMITDEGEHFSVNHVSANPEERDRLRHALLTPYVDTIEVTERYSRFAKTIQWVLETLKERPNQSTTEILRRHYKNISTAPDPSLNKVTRSWYEYELRRRCHFACELFLSAVTDTLQDLTEAVPEDILANWADRASGSELIESIISAPGPSFDQPLGELKSIIPGHLSPSDLKNQISQKKVKKGEVLWQGSAGFGIALNTFSRTGKTYCKCLSLVSNDVREFATEATIPAKRSSNRLFAQHR